MSKRNRFLRLGWLLPAAALISLSACDAHRIGPFAPRAPRIAVVESPPKGLQHVPVPTGTQMTQEKVDLGWLLYFDPRLSVAKDISCASCHAPELGWSDGLPVSIGHKGQQGTRNAPTVINSAYSTTQFWDGRAPTLEEQAKGPIENPIEMGFSFPALVKRLRGIPGYVERFEEAFEGPPSEDRIVQAIAAFERTVISGDAPFDSYMSGKSGALSESAQRGLQVFLGKGNCIVCHLGPNFTDNKFHNIGVGMDKKKPDLGRFRVTKKWKDRGAFKTPTLRNTNETAPYMHDGSLPTPESVIDFYNKGGIKNRLLDKEMRPLNLTDRDKADLLTFLTEGLSGKVTSVERPKSFPD